MQKIILWEVDVQADFVLPGGKLYVPGAEKIIPGVKSLVETAAQNGIPLISSADAHTVNDPEFARFPPHCIKGTPGALIIPEGLLEGHLLVPNEAVFVLPREVQTYKQIIIEKQTLDVFDNPHAGELVELFGPEAEYFVFGVVTELCVLFAAKGLLKRGRHVSVIRDAVETLEPERGEQALEELQGLGANLITTSEALAVAARQGRDREGARRAPHP